MLGPCNKASVSRSHRHKGGCLAVARQSWTCTRESRSSWPCSNATCSWPNSHLLNAEYALLLQGFTIYQDPVASSSPSSPQLPSQENHHLHNDVSFMSAVSSPEEIDDKENEATSIIGRSSDLQPQQRQQILPPVHYQKEICKYIKERQVKA